MQQLPEEVPIPNSNSVNDKFADNFFQRIFESKEAIQDLLHFVGEETKVNQMKADQKKADQKMDLEVIHPKPVLIGNRRNDLSFLFHQTYYYFFEQQSTENYNMPVRLLFYIAYALENYLKGKRIFQKSRLKIPEIKCYVLFTGIAETPIESLETIQKLSDAYLSQEVGKKEKQGKKGKEKQENAEEKKTFDLELYVHCFHLKATEEEMELFLKENQIPKRFQTIESISVQYAMFVNVIKYKLKKETIKLDTIQAKQIVLETCELFLERNYLTEYLKDPEVIDMAVEQLSYEEIIRFQEREEGREEGEREKLKKQVIKKLERGKSVEVIADELEDDINTIWQVIIEIKKENNPT